VTWLPFELHPEAPPEGIPREVYFGRERSDRIHSHLQSVADSIGLKMQTREVIINSRRALGLAELARERGLYEPVHHALFKAHWEGTGKLEDVDDLVRIGESAGLDGAEARDVVETGRYDPVIDENRRLATSAGIDAIPAHVFGRRYLVMGAQPYDVLEQVVGRVTAGS
jgi:predicted DsbA family dithiol-disulfide isomerase